MLRRLAIAASVAAAGACGQGSEKFCAEPSFVQILEGGALAFDGVSLAVDKLAAAMESRSMACGGTLQVFLEGYGVGDRELNARVLQIIEDTPNALLVRVGAGVEDPPADRGSLRRVVPRQS